MLLLLCSGFVPAILCCAALPVLAQQIEVTVNWASPTGISSTDTSFGVNADHTDPRVVGYPGNPIYKNHLAHIGAQYLRIWGGQWSNYTTPGGWLFHHELADESWDANKIKNTFIGYAPYKPTHIMVEIGGWPAWMNDPASDPKKPRLDPKHFADFAKYCADLVRIINKENPGGRHVDMFELPNERDDAYQGLGDGLIMGRFVAQAAAAMKLVDPTIQVGGPAYAWAVQGETKNFLTAAGNSIDFISWHEYATGVSSTTTSAVWQNGNRGLPNQKALTMKALLVQTLGHPLPMFVDEYAVNYDCWKVPDDRCANATEAVYDGLKVVSYLRAGVTGSAKWNMTETTYGLMDGHDDKFTYRPAAYLFTVLNQHFIGREMTTATSDGTKLVPFAVRESCGNGSLLLVHSVENVSDRVILDLQNFYKPPRKIIVNTITDSGLSTTTIPFSKHLSLTLPPTSITALILERKGGRADLK